MDEVLFMMNETLPNPSLSFQGGDIRMIYCLDTPVKPEYDREERPRMIGKKRLEDG